MITIIIVFVSFTFWFYFCVEIGIWLDDKYKIPSWSIALLGSAIFFIITNLISN